MLEALLGLVVLALVVWIVSGPLRAGAQAAADKEALRVADLEAAKEAKYREIRETEQDFRAGKLSEADWKVMDRELRAEAVELLRQLDSYHQ